MRGFGGFDSSMSKGVLNKLEMLCLRLRKIEVEGVAVVKFRVNSGGAMILAVYRSCYGPGLCKLAVNLHNVKFKKIISYTSRVSLLLW